jgi:hypothetical protein
VVQLRSCMEVVRKTRKSQDVQYPGRHFNPGPTEHEVRLLPTQSRRSINQNKNRFSSKYFEAYFRAVVCSCRVKRKGKASPVRGHEGP